MKKVIGILGIIITAALWYGSLQSVADSPSLSFVHTGKPGTTQEVYARSFSIDLFRHTSPSESSVKSFHTSFSASQNPLNGFWAILKLSERLFESKFAQYISISNTFLIKFRKADIIFPFHYFW